MRSHPGAPHESSERAEVAAHGGPVEFGLTRSVRSILRLSIAIALLALVAWWSLALRFRLPGSAGLATAVAVAYAAAVLGVLIWLRPFHRAVLTVLGSFVVLGFWWSTIRASNDR